MDELDPEATRSDEAPDVPAAPLLPRLHRGEVIGEFEVEAFHAEGGWSDVYRAHHVTRDLGPIALKIMPLDLAGQDPPYPTLTHVPHLVEVFAVGRVAERQISFVAMRLVLGRGLDRWLVDGTARDSSNRRYLVERFAEVASALAHLHRRRVVHRDVKPGNILIEVDATSGQANAVLVDLGFARSLGADTSLSTVFATVPYAAPEQLLGLDIDCRVDVFGLGLSMHDLLSGRAPHRRQRRPAVGMESLTALVPGIDPDLAAIVAEAVAPDRAHRYANAGDLGDDLRRHLAGRPPTVRPRSLWGRAVRCRGRRPAVFYRRTTLVVLAVGFLVGVVLIITSAFGHLGARHAIERAVDRGDLHAALQLEARLSPVWCGLGLPSPVRAEATDRALASVLDLLRSQQHEEAGRLAARWISGDGAELHPVLAHWLLWRATAGDVKAATWIGQALSDHPVADRDDATAKMLREHLLRLVAAANDAVALHALAALGGVLGPDDLPAMTAVWLARTDRHSSPLEMLRLGLEVSGRVLVRSAITRAITAQESATAVAGFAQVAGFVGRQADIEGLRRNLEGPMHHWLLALRRMHTRAGLQLPERSMLRMPWSDNVLTKAIWGDDGLMNSWREEAERCGPFELGFAVAVACDERAERLREVELEAATLAKGERWQMAFTAGLRAGADALRGPNDPYAIDAGSRLADAKDPGVRFEALVVGTAEPTVGAKRPIAAWSFLTVPAAMGGSATAAAVRSVRMGEDEVEVASHYLGLGCAGVSAVLLSFRDTDATGGPFSLVVSLQKSQRGALPFGGEAGLVVEFDGLSIATISDMGSASPTKIVVPLGRMQAGRQRQLYLGLQADANTTIRLFEAWIE